MLTLIMIDLQPNETDLIGAWVSVNGVVMADPVTRRIEALVAHSRAEQLVLRPIG